jgi:carboxypeptidase C (cathepsin A)
VYAYFDNDIEGHAVADARCSRRPAAGRSLEPRLRASGARSKLAAMVARSFALVVSLLAGPLGTLQEGPPAAPAAAPSAPEPRTFRSTHSGTFNGTRVDYTATAAETILTDEKGAPEASIFSIAYVADGAAEPEARPVTFLWNGGPGSASLWLHMGVYGPKRVDVPSDARDDGGPPYGLLDNEGAFLDVSDVVFIDPVGTGFSRALGEKEGKDFWGVRADARSIARFIRQWIGAHGRWNSPKFIGGESYGTTRAAAVVRELEGGFDDVAINGILLISAILDFSLDSNATGNELGYVTMLPTMAATARYHGVTGTEVPLERFVAEAREFALGEYAHALLAGTGLAPEDRARVRSRLARFTGLSEAYLDLADLRVRPDRFQKELLRDRGLTVGRLDSRYTGRDLDAAGESPDHDPSFYGIDGAYATALNAWLRGPLEVDLDAHYTVIGGLSGAWDWELDDPFYFNVAPYVGAAMRQNAGLEVLVACGYYDMATPFFGAEYSLRRSGVVPERLHFAYYEAGHMMYVNHAALAALQRDTREFLVRVTGRGRRGAGAGAPAAR